MSSGPAASRGHRGASRGSRGSRGARGRGRSRTNKAGSLRQHRQQAHRRTPTANPPPLPSDDSDASVEELRLFSKRQLRAHDPTRFELPDDDIDEANVKAKLRLETKKWLELDFEEECEAALRALNHSKQDEELLSDCIAAQLNLDIDALADALDAIPIEERLRLPPGFIEPQPRSEMVKALREPKQEDAVLSPQENKKDFAESQSGNRREAELPIPETIKKDFVEAESVHRQEAELPIPEIIELAAEQPVQAVDEASDVLDSLLNATADAPDNEERDAVGDELDDELDRLLDEL